VLLIGAYQDTMGDMHNLFGRVHEAEVMRDSLGRTRTRRVVAGERARDTLGQLDYDAEELVDKIRHELAERVESGSMAAEEADSLLEDYRTRLERYTYLD